MSNQKTCPACGASLNRELNRCPKCGLEGLSRVFLSREDYQDWVRDVLEPHKQMLQARKRPCRVYAGLGFGLILTGAGDLYGFGSNATGCLGETTDENVLTPVPMAKNVVSAAAGYCCTIYLGEDGEVRLIGRSQVDYMKCFQLPAGRIKAVYASPVQNVFWLRMDNDSLWSWGSNIKELIAPRTAKTLHTFQEIALRIEYEGSIRKYYSSHTCGTPAYVDSGYYQSNTKDLVEGEILRLKNTPHYSRMAQQYGEDNLEIWFEPEPKKTRVIKENEEVVEDHYHSRGIYGEVVIGLTKIQEEFFLPRLRLYNTHILSPVRVSAGTYQDRVFEGSGLVRKDNGRDLLQESDKKICLMDSGAAAALTRDGYLEFIDTAGRRRLLAGVSDFSAAGDTVYLLGTDGRVSETTQADLQKGAPNLREICLP